MFTRRLLVREEESHLRGKLLFNSKERSLPTFFSTRGYGFILSSRPRGRVLTQASGTSYNVQH